MANDRRVIHALAALTCWLALASSAAAQSMLGGVVSYPTGQVAANVTVVAEKEDTGETWNSRSSSLGIYSFYHLPNGTYTIRVNFSQLSFVAAGIQVRPRQKTALDIPLCICEVITVRGSSALPRRLSDGSLGAAYSREAIDGMSLTNGPNLQSIISAIPGINFTESYGTLAQFTAIGQPRFSNRLSIDGISVDLAVDVNGRGIGQAGSGTLPAFSVTGGTQTVIPFSAIDEIQIRTTNASSEYARTPGAQTVIVTRSGSDQFKWAASANVRPQGLAATDWFINAGERPESRSRYWDTGASASGPIVPKRVVFFATWEHQRIDRSVRDTHLVPSRSVRNAVVARPGGADMVALLNAFPVPNGPESSTEQGLAEDSRLFPALSHLSTASVRLDTNLSSRHRIFIRGSRGDSEGDAINERNLPSFNTETTEATTTTTMTLGLNSAWQSATHELRLGANWHRGTATAGTSRIGDSLPFPMAALIAPGVSTEDAWVNVLIQNPPITIQSGRYASHAQLYRQLSDTWSVLGGRHEWRFGFEYQEGVSLADGADNRYDYRFRTFQDFVQGRLQFVSIDRSLPSRARRQSWSAFAQDSFRVTPRLTLDYGVRYVVRPAPESRTEVTPYLLDYDSLPLPVPAAPGSPLWKTSWGDVASRVTAAYQLGTEPGRETTLRGGGNVTFDDRANSGLRVFGGDHAYLSTNQVRSDPFPVEPQRLVWSPAPMQFVAGDFSDYYSFHKDLKTPRTYEWLVTLDQALGRTQQVSLGYVGTSGRDLIYGYSHDLGSPVINAYSNDGRSKYHAFLMEYGRRRSRGLQGRLSYTWSHSIDLDSGENRRPNPPPSEVTPRSNRASSDFDRRHMLRVSASYAIFAPPLPRPFRQLFEDWQLDVVGLVQSGTPFSVKSAGVLAGGVYDLRPNEVAGEPTWIADQKSPTGWSLNPARFVFPEEAQGVLGRNTFRASPLRQVDLSLSRALRFKHLVAHLRLDAFNVFNIANFAPPNNEPLGAAFGQPVKSYADGLGTGTLFRGGLVPIHQIGGPRSLQVGLRLTY